MPSALRILIVDDSDVTRRILGTIVRSRHWTVCGEAEDGWHRSRTVDVRLGPNRANNPLYSVGFGGPRNARLSGGHLCGRFQS